MTLTGDSATLSSVTIQNNGSFTDSTGMITNVTGSAALSISHNLSGGGTVTEGDSIKLTAQSNDNTGTIHYIWQKRETNGIFTTIEGATHTYKNGELQTCAVTTPLVDVYKINRAQPEDASEYRCLIQREATNNSGQPATTMLVTGTACVTVKAPEPVSITLPAIVGAATNLAAGKHTVNKGSSFIFSLTLEADYDQSKPIVATSAGDTIIPRADGKYVIEKVSEDIQVAITGIKKNSTVNNSETGDNASHVWTQDGHLFIHSGKAEVVRIYTIIGTLAKTIRSQGGDVQLELPSDIYVVAIGNKSYKIKVN